MRILPHSFVKRDTAARRAAKVLGWELSRKLATYTIYHSATQDVLASGLWIQDVENWINKANRKVIAFRPKKRGYVPRVL